jgi:hypothetical protein
MNVACYPLTTVLALLMVSAAQAETSGKVAPQKTASFDLPDAGKHVSPIFLSPGPHRLDSPEFVAVKRNVRLNADKRCWESEDGKVGVVRTALVVFRAGKGSQLVLDASAEQGKTRVQFRDGRGQVIPGFSFADCRPVTGDGLAQPVQWKRPLNDLKGAAFRLEFSLRNARLYGFSFAQELQFRREEQSIEL